ncbi:MAG: THUMP domain-containing protein [Candidatus Bathyarchaeota archaeon]
MAKVRELFFHVSGEHETLPHAEVKAILEAEGFPCRSVIALPQLLCIESDVDCLPTVADRGCFTKECGVVIFRCEARREAIMRAVKDADYSSFIEKGQTFSVKIKTAVQPNINTEELASTLGRIILGKLQGIKVKLKDPDISFFGIVSCNRFILGRKTHDSSREFLRRKPNSRPFSHPSSISPQLARVMANLARVRASSRVLDPFCGTGSILVEAGLIGCKIFGSEINSEMLRGTRLNLNYFGVIWEGLVISDARYLPFVNVDSVVTDPPYGRASSTHGQSVRSLVVEFLSEASDILHSGSYMSIALPDSLPIREISKDLGYINVENHFIRQHKSLTREISIIQKP